jgi:hypothetical protein
MTISSVSFYPLSAVAPALQAPVASTSGTTQSSAPGWATISRSGEVLSKLQALGESDPSKLQAALTHVSQDLQTSAQSATGSKADALGDLANRFAQAASSGDLSALGASAHHRHHASAASPSVSAASAVASGATGSSATDSGAQSILPNVLEQMDEAMGMNPPPLGPWFTAQ